jgi:hypothetical protein
MQEELAVNLYVLLGQNWQVLLLLPTLTRTRLLAHVDTHPKLTRSLTEYVPVEGQLMRQVPKTGCERNLPEVQEVQLVGVILQVLQYAVAELQGRHRNPVALA